MSDMHIHHLVFIWGDDKYGGRKPVGRKCEVCDKIFTLNGTESETHKMTPNGRGMTRNKSHDQRLMGDSSETPPST